jgi:N-methylhydantoinase B
MPGKNMLTPNDRKREVRLPGKVHLTLRPGDRLTIQTPGGGGHGEARRG